MNEELLKLVQAEIGRQDLKWGSNRLLPMPLWATILSEECGEVSRAILECDLQGLKEELIQVIALTMQIYKAISLESKKCGTVTWR